MMNFTTVGVSRNPHHFQTHADADFRYPLVESDPLLCDRVLVLVDELVDVLAPLI